MTVIEGKVETETLLTSAEVARLLQVDATSIINWSKKGYLRYYRTPGGHRRIKAGDVVAFVRSRNMPVPTELAGLDERLLLLAVANQKDVKAIKKSLEPFGAQVKATFSTSIVQVLLQLAVQRPHVLVLDPALDNEAVNEAVATIKLHPELAELQVVLFDPSQPSEKLVTQLLVR